MVFTVLRRLGLPAPLLGFLEAIYENIRCYGAAGHIRTFPYYITSGVPQGCPASGVIYAISSHPFLRHLYRSVEQASQHESLARACADDVGGVIHDLSVLRHFKTVFDASSEIAGL
eukprot:1637795-Pyramimonas_sp.AAC.1